MRKTGTFLVTALLFFVVHVSFSQEHFNEVSISYGLATTDDMSSAFGSIFEDIVYDIFGDSTNIGSSSSGVFLFSYQHQFSKVISAGPVFGYEMLETEVTKNGEIIGKIDHNSFTIAIESRVDYLNRDIFGMYLGLGFGATIINTKSSSDGSDVDDVDPDSHFNFHVTALGFRVGKKLGATAELGYGYRGILNAGVYYRF